MKKPKLNEAGKCEQCQSMFDAKDLKFLRVPPQPFSGLGGADLWFCRPCYRMNEDDAAYTGACDGRASIGQNRYECVGQE